MNAVPTGTAPRSYASWTAATLAIIARWVLAFRVEPTRVATSSAADFSSTGARGGSRRWVHSAVVGGPVSKDTVFLENAVVTVAVWAGGF